MSGKKKTKLAVPSEVEFVKEGVRRFILNHASLGEFQKTVRDASANGEMSPHPLTGVEFRRIVEEAIAERNSSINTSPTRKKPKQRRR